MSHLPALIEIYGRQPVEDVTKDPKFKELAENDGGTKFFHTERQRVEEVKGRLEKCVGIQLTRQKQVTFSLKVFRQFLGSDDQKGKICDLLTRRAYYPDWTEKQKDYFDTTLDRLRNGQDYFLSFTQRNQPGAGNPVNGTHRHLIQSFGLPDPITSRDNELARMLDRFLSTSRHQFRGFFFPKHEDDSQSVSLKLDEAINRAQVFIELVQNAMFSRQYPYNNNYCFDEYSKAVARRMDTIYVFADGSHPLDLIDEFDTYNEFVEWHQCIHGADCMDFKPTATADPEAIAANRTKLKDRLEEKLFRFREALWDNVPGDID